MSELLEINKKIAELKGVSVFYHETLCWWADESTGKPIVNFAENISDAWELFEEMVNYSDDFHIFFHNHDILWTVDDAEENLFTSSARTAPLAICKAWIKWKEINAK